MGKKVDTVELPPKMKAEVDSKDDVKIVVSSNGVPSKVGIVILYCN